MGRVFRSDVVRAGFPLPTAASPILGGALKDGFGGAVTWGLTSTATSYGCLGTGGGGGGVEGVVVVGAYVLPITHRD